MPKYLRVRDDTTGHEYDVLAGSEMRGVTPIEGYPTHEGDTARPRPPKHHVDKAGQPATPRAARKSTPPPVEAQPAETE